MNYKILTDEDYNDIVDISKNIWDGNDYLPKVFYKWVNEKDGCFLGVVKDGKVVAVESIQYFQISKVGLRVLEFI
ncbi:acetyltransferase, GNAT family domain protein [[Clostridium] sordellii ATCC 9714]|nr:acetyltransferase, GNAT family domain protein [[Clostridium] sordellii ATCC 9714] [Paeniclostridium sordellii ATCC 9714]